jgi:hypothetical protein
MFFGIFFMFFVFWVLIKSFWVFVFFLFWSLICFLLWFRFRFVFWVKLVDFGSIYGQAKYFRLTKSRQNQVKGLDLIWLPKFLLKIFLASGCVCQTPCKPIMTVLVLEKNEFFSKQDLIYIYIYDFCLLHTSQYLQKQIAFYFV